MVDPILQKKVGSLFVVGFEGKQMTPQLRNLIHHYHIGGIILFSRNIGTPEEVLILTRTLQKEAKNAGYTYPLLICIDQENGVVRRLGEGATIFPGAMAQGATHNPDNAYTIGVATGKELKALGINWNLAPVLDVNNNSDNPVIGVRSFGESPEQVALFGKASMQGMQRAGVATTLKHFPGHGDTHVDSHLDLPVINHDIDRLEKMEFIPFQQCIDAGADVIMAAHIYFPALEKEKGIPATLSKNVLTHLLREKLGFNGVITTDCMEMNAISKTIGTEKGAVAALKAGADLVMVSHTYERQIGAIKEVVSAMERGELDERNIKTSMERVHRLNKKYVSWEESLQTDSNNIVQIVGSPKHEQLAFDVYKNSVTIVKNEQVLPLQLNENNKILVLEPLSKTRVLVEDKNNERYLLGNAIKEFHSQTDIELIELPVIDKQIEDILEYATNYDYIIFGTLTISSDPLYQQLIHQLHDKDTTLIGIGMRNPYDISCIKGVDAFINTYEPNKTALKVAASAIFGKVDVKGKLPVRIDG